MISFTDIAKAPRLGRKHITSPRFGGTQKVKSKSPVQLFTQTTYLAVRSTQTRPRCRGKGVFSIGTSGFFQVSGRHTPDELKGKRQFDPCLTQPRTKSPVGKRLLESTQRGDPILQDEERYSSTPGRGRRKVADWKPSGLTEFQNDRRLLRPAERGIVRGQDS